MVLRDGAVGLTRHTKPFSPIEGKIPSLAYDLYNHPQAIYHRESKAERKPHETLLSEPLQAKNITYW